MKNMYSRIINQPRSMYISEPKINPKGLSRSPSSALGGLWGPSGGRKGVQRGSWSALGGLREGSGGAPVPEKICLRGLGDRQKVVQERSLLADLKTRFQPK